MIANGLSFSEVLDEYQYLEKEDIRQALKYASWTVSDQRPQSIQNMMETIMPVIENCAEQGNAIFSVSDNKVRIRHLPIA
uniref:DUF433 domain-containing protein n=1 Tax=uncultured bacterium contig00017 TaxID=1181508 RepID=A0A806KAQ0_9BACT|nr:hypothetical protein [uncultured bacterium contig00017]